jgi:rod shape-determining protein MreC
VLLITDRESGVGALLASTRTHGVIKGTGNPLLWMDYVSTEEKVTAGEQVLTSGEDRIFPKNLPVGWVASTKGGFPFQTIEVTPAAHLDRLEEVLVLLSEKPFTPHPANEVNSSTQQKAPARVAQGAHTPESVASGNNSEPSHSPASGVKKAPEPSAKKVASTVHPGTPQ